jgi:hypothetical protein
MGGFEQGIVNLGATLSDPFRNSLMGSPTFFPSSSGDAARALLLAFPSGMGPTLAGSS